MGKTYRAVCLGLVVISMGLLVAASGCSTTRGGNRMLVSADLHRDTETAAKLAARGMDLYEAGQLDQAEDILKRALEADLMFGPARNTLGMIYYQQAKYYQAAWEFEHASRLMPDRPEPRNNLGLVFEAAGKLDQAVAWYEKALDLAPDNTQMIGNLARTRMRRGNYDATTRDLLDQLVLKDTRPDWRDWAKEQRAMLSHTDGARTGPIRAGGK